MLHGYAGFAESPPMDCPCENPGETPGSVFVADAEKFGRQTE